MNCPNCSVPVEEGQITCHVCGQQIAVGIQEKKVRSAYDTTKTIIKNRVHAPVFLAATIFMTIMLITHIASMASTLIGLIVGVVSVVFMGISMVAGYRLHSNNPEVNVPKSLKNFSRYEACTKIYYTIAYIVVIVVSGVSVLGFLMNDYMVAYENTPNNGNVLEYFSPDILPLLIIIFGASAVVAVFWLFKTVYVARHKAFVNMYKAAETGEYVPVLKRTFVLSYVMGGFTIFGAVALVVAPAFVDLIVDLLPPAFDFLKVVIIAGSITTSLSGISVGVYVILSAKWLSGTQKELISNNQVIAAEEKELENINEEIKKQKEEMAKAEKEAEKAAFVAKEVERAELENERRAKEFEARAEIRAFVTELLENEHNTNVEFWTAFKTMQEDEQKNKLEFWATFRTMQEENEKIRAEINEKYVIVEEQMKLLQQIVMQQIANNSNGNQNPTIITAAPYMFYPTPQQEAQQQPAPAPAPVAEPVVEETPVVEEEAPVAEEEAPVAEEEAPVAEEEAPAAEEEAPVAEEEAPAAEEEAPAAEEEAPVAEEEAPAAEEEAPVVEEEAPAAEEEAPVVEEEAPVVEEEAPVAEEEAPVAEEEAPVVEEEAPVAEEEAPVVEEEAPAAEEEAPAAEEEAPAAEEEAPAAEEEAPAAEEEAPAAEEEAPAAEEEAPAAEEEAPAAEEEAPAENA